MVLDRPFTRFLLAGGVNTVFGLAVYAGFLEILGVTIWQALLASLLSGVGFNFLTLGGYAFRRLSLQRLPRFVAAYVFIFSLNMGLLELMRPWVANPLVAQAILVAPLALTSYFLMSRIVFSEKTETRLSS